MSMKHFPDRMEGHQVKIILKNGLILIGECMLEGPDRQVVTVDIVPYLWQVDIEDVYVVGVIW